MLANWRWARFDTKDEGAILAAAAGVMQDLGFTIEETQAKAELVSGSKDRDAVEAQQVAGQIFLRRGSRLGRTSRSCVG